MSNAKKRFFNLVLVPFFPRFATNFLQYFSMATKKKKKKKKNGLSAYPQAEMHIKNLHFPLAGI